MNRMKIERIFTIGFILYIVLYIWIFIRNIHYMRVFIMFFFFGFGYSAIQCSLREAKKEEEKEKEIKEESKRYILFDKDTEFIYTIV
jgi:hypothetical protein